MPLKTLTQITFDSNLIGKVIIPPDVLKHSPFNFHEIITINNSKKTITTRKYESTHKTFIEEKPKHYYSNFIIPRLNDVQLFILHQKLDDSINDYLTLMGQPSI